MTYYRKGNSANGLLQRKYKKKSKETRVCADFSTGLNAALKDYHYPLPIPKEVFNKSNGGKVFSKIDLSEAYLQIPVEENSSKLLCINTHRELYKFDRLVFGIKVAPAIFQQVMDTMLGGFDFNFNYLDDIVISCKTKELHREHLNKVFTQIQEFRFKVKEAKCDFCMNKIKYLGHIIDKNGRRLDPERATAIKDMPAPDNVTLQSFLGLANYNQSFIKNLLNELLKKIKSGDGSPNVKQHLTKLKRHQHLIFFSRTTTQNWRLLSQEMPAHMGLVHVFYIKCPMGQKSQ